MLFCEQSGKNQRLTCCEQKRIDLNRMITKIAVATTLVFLIAVCQAQTGRQYQKVESKKEDVARQKLLLSSSANPLEFPEADFEDILIATNEDCLFLLNEQVKGVALKEAFLYLKLPPGTYRFTAKNQKTGDVLSDSFSVSRWKLNEVFIDMLYVMDLEKNKKERLKNTTAPLDKAPDKNKDRLQKETVKGSYTTLKEEERQVVLSIMANMTAIPGGRFVMGNNRSPAVDEAEHQVVLNSFFMSKYEVTQEQWGRLMGYNPSLNRGCASCPVENVSWEEVMKFIRKINSLTNKRYRLPTEAEWEYVARLGGKEEIEKAGGIEEYIRNTAWSFVNSGHRTHPVGKKQPNAAGIYDLFGNVSEWCSDWYDAFFFKEDDTEINPEGPPLGKEKVIRGGNYKDYVGDRFRPSFRNKMNPKTRGSEVGFRLVMDGSNIPGA